MSKPQAIFSQLAEQNVLGSLLIDPQAYFEIAHMVETRDFFIERHQHIYRAIGDMHDQGADVDFISVQRELEKAGQLDAVGGPAYLTELLTASPTSLTIATHARDVRQMAIRRRLIEGAREVATLANEDGESDPETLVANAEAALAGAVGVLHSDSLVTSEQAHSEFYDRLIHLYEHRDEGFGIPSGFTDVDEVLGGFRPGNLITIAARPGMGKTALLVNIAIRAAKRAKHNVAIFSLEMSRDELVRRMVAHECGVNSELLRDGDLTEEQLSKATHAIATNSDFPIFIDDDPNGTLELVRAKARRIHAQHGLGMVMIDYLGLMHAAGYSPAFRVQEVTAITSGLKQLSKELGCPVVVAHQLNREVERRANKRPMLSDLRESGSVEQDSDVVMFIYRDEVYNENTEYPNKADIIIAKHRNGRTGTVGLHYTKQLTRFDNLGTIRAQMEKFA